MPNNSIMILVTLYFEEAWSCQIHLSFISAYKIIGSKRVQHSFPNSPSQVNKNMFATVAKLLSER